MKKTLISLLLVLSMLLSCALPAFATQAPAAEAAAASKDPVSLGQTEIPYEGEVVTGFAPNEEAATAGDVKVETPSDSEATLDPRAERLSDTVQTQTYAADDEVTFIVVLETLPLLKAGFSTTEIASATRAVADYQAVQQQAINALRRSVTTELGVEAEIGFTYTIATTGMAVKTTYGNKAALENMKGVDYVYVAPTFSLPETEELTPSTSNAGTMIGAD